MNNGRNGAWTEYPRSGPVARMGPVTSSSEGGLGSVSGMSPI